MGSNFLTTQELDELESGEQPKKLISTADLNALSGEEEKTEIPTSRQIESSMMSFGEKAAVAGPFVALYDKLLEKINGTEQERTRGFLALTYAHDLNLKPSFAYRHKESIDNYYKEHPENNPKRDAIMAKIRAYNDSGFEGDSYLTRMYKGLRRVPFTMQVAAGGILRFLEENADPYSLGLRIGAEFQNKEEEKQTYLAAADAWDARQIKRWESVTKSGEESLKKWEPDVIPGSFKDVVGMATETTVNNLLLLATLGPLGRGTFLTGFGGQAFGQSYAEQIKGGSSRSTATIASLINAGSEVATEFIPAGIYLKPSKNLVTTFVKAQFAEIPGESINQIVNDVVDKVTIHPEMTLGQAVDNVVTTIQVTALSTGAFSATTHSVNKVIVKTLMPTHGDIIKQEVDKALLDGDTPQVAVKKAIDVVAQTPDGKKIIDDKVAQLKKEAADFEKERSTKPFIIGTEENEQGDVTSFTMADPVTGRTFNVPAIQTTETGDNVKLVPDVEAIAAEMEKINLKEAENFDLAVSQFLESGQDVDTFMDSIFGQENLTETSDIIAEIGKERNLTPEQLAAINAEIEAEISEFKASLPATSQVYKSQVNTMEAKGMALANRAEGQAEDPLIAEARKYKTAEEFVNNSFLVRGDSGRSAETSLGIEGGKWATDSIELAGTFGDNIHYVAKPTKILNESAFQLADRVGKDDFSELTASEWEQIRNDLIKEGYDAVNLGEGHMDGANDFWILNHNVPVYPKSQITDIWNKAQEGQAEKPISLKMKNDQQVKDVDGKMVTLSAKEPFYRIEYNDDNTVTLVDGKEITIKLSKLDDLDADFSDKPNPAFGGMTPEMRAKRGAQNLVTRIIELGGIDFGKDYNTKLLRQDKDSARVIKATGKSPDAMTAILQAEGWQIESSDHLVELLKSGEARKIYAPNQSDELLKRDAEKEVEAWVKGNLAELGIEYKDVKQIKAELKKAQKEYRAGNKDVQAEVKKNLLWIARRIESLRNIRDSLNLTEEQMRNVSRRNPLLMEPAEFKKYLNAVELRALELAEERHARASLVQLIADKNLQKVDNYRRALELPTINQMNTQQLNTFFELLEQYQDDDVFLTERQLETVDRTEFKGIRTWREAREKIAEKLGVHPDEIKPVHSGWLDSYRWDTVLREQGAVYKLVVDTMTRKTIEAEIRAHDIESEIYKLAKKAQKSRPRTVTQKLIPQDEIIFAYMEAPAEDKSKIAATMTKEELALAHYAQQYYADFLNYLLSIRAIDRGRQNYVTHVRKSFLETLRDDGVKAAFTNYFKNMEEDQIAFNILDDDTGNILPLEKFFQFSMRRTGELQPTQNFVRAFMTYVNTAEKKRMYDEVIPLLAIVSQAVTPQEFTQRGLEFDRSFKTFINKWINNKKGRRISFDSALRQGGKIDVAIRAMRTFTMIRDLGLNIPVGLAATMGEQVTNATMLGWGGWTKGTARMRTEQGKKILKKYEGWVGRSVWEEMTAPGKDIGDRLSESIMALFRISTVTANKQFLLGSMTDAEFANGNLSAERLADLRLDMGRFRVVDGVGSLVGSTSLGSAGLQYKKWAVPILRTTWQDIQKTISDMKTKPYGEKLSSREAQEVKRILYISGTMFIVGALIGADDDDNSYLGKLKSRIYREGQTLMQGISPWTWLSVPRVLTFMAQVGDLIKSVVTLETYKTTGELKAVKKGKRLVTPAAVGPLLKDDKKKERR